ncbi:MAG: peptide-methionine (R)-S-oxide reductase [Nonlabens sp.]|jgi:peptide-methionine (R)-S-oxide reductase
MNSKIFIELLELVFYDIIDTILNIIATSTIVLLRIFTLNKNRMIKHIVIAVIALVAVSCGNTPKEIALNSSNEEVQQEKKYQITKTDAQWKEFLEPSAYNVLREAGTERPNTSPLNKQYAPGTLICGACFAPVYENENKFDSGTGWPSYDRAVEGQVERDVDYKLGYARTELKCNTCGSHLGHEFNDGPKKTTGKRHCINGVALDFVPKGEELPALRK